jgi:hypothetical protein
MPSMLGAWFACRLSAGQRLPAEPPVRSRRSAAQCCRPLQKPPWWTGRWDRYHRQQQQEQQSRPLLLPQLPSPLPHRLHYRGSSAAARPPRCCAAPGAAAARGCCRRRPSLSRLPAPSLPLKWPQAGVQKSRPASLLPLPLLLPLPGVAQQTSLLAAQRYRRSQQMHPAPRPQTSRLAGLPLLALLLQGLGQAGRCRHVPRPLLLQWQQQQPSAGGCMAAARASPDVACWSLTAAAAGRRWEGTMKRTRMPPLKAPLPQPPAAAQNAECPATAASQS